MLRPRTALIAFTIAAATLHFSPEIAATTISSAILQSGFPLEQRNTLAKDTQTAVYNWTLKNVALWRVKRTPW